MRSIRNMMVSALTLALLTACGANMSRQVTAQSSSSSASQNDVEASANNEIDNKLELVGIEEVYQDAHNIYPSKYFSSIEDLLAVVCKDSPIQFKVDDAHKYSDILGVMGAVEKVDLVLALAKDDRNNYPTTNRLEILNLIISKLEDKKSHLLALSAACAKVKLSDIKADPAPVPVPPTDS